MADINKDVIGANVVSESDTNEVSWDKYIALLEERLQKATIRDEHEAYRLYCEYAHAMGFSVRKGKSDYFSGSTKMRSKLFTCSKEGLNEIRIDKKGNVTERTGCQARIRFTRKIDGPFEVSKWTKEHNHEMAESNQRHLLRSAKLTGFFRENIMESHVDADVHPVDPITVEDDSMKHACVSQSQHYNSTESNQRHLLASAKLTGFFSENLMESHVDADVHPIDPMGVEDDNMKHACVSQSQQYSSTESNQRDLLRSAKLTGLLRENIMESHVDDPMAVEDDSMKDAYVSQSQNYNSTESEMTWSTRIIRSVNDLIMRSRGSIEARGIVEKDLENAHEKVGVIFQKQNEQVQFSKDAANQCQ